MRPAKAQVSLHIRTVSPEPSLFAHMKYGSRRRVHPKNRHLAQPMAAHVGLKNEFTEDEKCHNIMSWIKSVSKVGCTTCHKTEPMLIKFGILKHQVHSY